MRRHLFLALAALIAFGDCLRGGFHFDDYATLASPMVQQLSGIWRVWTILDTRPLTELTFWANYQLGGQQPFGYHLFSLILHIAAVLLLFQALQRLIPEPAAFVAGAFFAIHPLQSEAVAYISARATLLSTFFCLLSLNSWLSAKRGSAVMWFGIALLSKEECVAFPIVLWILGPRDVRAIGAMLGLGLAAGLRTLFVTKVVFGSGAGFSAGVTPLDYLAAQGIAILRYFRLVLIPWGFTIDPTIRVANSWEAIGAWCVVGAAVAIALRQRTGKWLVAGLILLLPSSSIFPAADLAADRRMYLPLVALSGFVGMWIWSWSLRKWKAGILAVAGAVLMALSIGRMEVWSTEETLWREAVERSPNKVRPKIQLARTLPPSEAIDLLNTAPDSADVASERGRVWMDSGQPARALGEFGKALALRPRDAHAINNRGVALFALGQKEAARQDFERALSLDPALQDARRNLAKVDTTPAK